MPSAPDWRSASAYAYVHELDRSEFAWEYLRRNPAYKRDYRTAVRRMESGHSRHIRLRGGACGFPFDPHLHADNAPLVWLPQLDPATVLLIPAPRPFTAVRALGSLDADIQAPGDDGEHWIVSDAEGRLPLLLIGGTTGATPVASVIPFDGTFCRARRCSAAPLAALDRRASDRALDQLTSRLQRQQLVFASARSMRIWPVRHIARLLKILFGRVAFPTGAAWKTHDLRGRTIRLVRTGFKLMRGGYLESAALLPPSTPKRVGR